MNNNSQSLQIYKEAGTKAIQSIKKDSLCELISFSHPPPAVLAVMQYVQTIIAGNYHDIDLNPANNRPKSTDWAACRKMACKDTHLFTKACIGIYQKFGNDSYLDERIAQVSKRIDNEGWTFEKIQKVSIACASLFIWVQSVVKYWKEFQKL